jgi:hypothetical protein
MLKEELVELAANASNVAYFAGRYGIGYGFEADLRFGESGYVLDEETGFKASAFFNTDTNEVVLSFAGTDVSAQDAYSNMLLGINQWEQNGQIALAYLEAATRAGNSILVTGHSLGGALAQYATHDLAAMMSRRPGQDNLTSNLRLVTFNSFGGQAGLDQRPDSLFNPSLLDPIASNINHFYVEGDLIARLGEGHVGGQTYLVPNLYSGGSRPLDPREADGLTLTGDLLFTQRGIAQGVEQTPE